MANKRKLNSKNPKWNKELKEKEWRKKKLIVVTFIYVQQK